jgi:ATP-dependent DNA ligase
MNFKPMLADPVELDILKYPVIVSPKLDGVRATFVNGRLLTRNLKPIPNKAVDEAFCSPAPLDGELIVGDPGSKSCFRDTMKVVSAHNADIKELRFHVFDMVGAEDFSTRYMKAMEVVKDSKRLIQVPHCLVHNANELLILEEDTLEQGFEGLMIRDPKGKYKFGRSTAREGGLLKLKRKSTSEAIVIGFVEQMHNANEAKVDNLGYTERSSHQANLIPMGTLGALQVRDVTSGVEFNIGTGFTFADRDEVWKNQPNYLGATCSYEFLPVGVKDKPRHPAFLGWRMKVDL